VKKDERTKLREEKLQQTTPIWHLPKIGHMYHPLEKSLIEGDGKIGIM
jgi:hypothetical protein